MVERKTVSQCVSADYCRGWNDAVDAMPKWVSVEERLPCQNGKYLVLTESEFCLDAWFSLCDGDKGEFGYYEQCFDPDTLANLGSEWCVIQDITHWMPLPPAPNYNKEEQS